MYSVYCNPYQLISPTPHPNFTVLKPRFIASLAREGGGFKVGGGGSGD